jgi:hypothetical protein
MPVWIKMPQALKKGEKPAFDLFFDQSIWEYMGSHPEDATTFSGAMSGYAELRKSLLRRLDSEVAAAEGDVVVDVGGADGAMLAFVLQEPRPHARGVLFDQPHVAQGT